MAVFQITNILTLMEPLDYQQPQSAADVHISLLPGGQAPRWLPNWIMKRRMFRLNRTSPHQRSILYGSLTIALLTNSVPLHAPDVQAQQNFAAANYITNVDNNGTRALLIGALSHGIISFTCQLTGSCTQLRWDSDRDRLHRRISRLSCAKPLSQPYFQCPCSGCAGRRRTGVDTVTVASKGSRQVDELLQPVSSICNGQGERSFQVLGRSVPGTSVDAWATRDVA